ncbi:HD domain-containing protein [Candidatus Cetobacterium colombiensis]|uniref:HD domain-containing protein n=1 Tax=Candidatus Cetobacterium colombiensis TaxID=3073100 RepID=A0ABU4WAE2_9FUSO|nr:HD domain-containing protein [Candidatus Cetobacterium colombiensis]MDX8336508.1 HD domain-containing protein [Candidatus Cetobacterium colombiensis]
MTYSVIEINSTFIEMKIYEKKDSGYKVLEKVSEDLNLFKEIKDKKEISLEKMRKICDILKKMDNLSRDYGAFDKKVIFSEFFKNITNFPMMLDQIKLKVNLPVENADLSEKTYYSIKKLIHLEKEIFSKKESRLFFNLKSFSSGVYLFYKGELCINEHINLGTEKLYSILEENNITTKKAFDFICDYLESYVEFVRRSVGRKIIKKLILEGELEEKILKLIFGKKDLKNITLNELKEKLKFFQEHSYNELAFKYGCSVPMAKLMMTSICLIVSFSDYFEVKEIKFLDFNIKDICALEKFYPEIKYSFDETLWKITLDSVIELGEKFDFDKEHSEFVKQIGIKLLDKLKYFHSLGIKDYKYFIVAAYLHDIGKAIDFENHSEHSAYILENTSIFGLNRDMIEKIVFIVRAHTSNAKLEDLYNYGFKGEELIKLLKIISVIKIATSLDRGKKQRLYNEKIHLDKNNLIIEMDTDEDFYMEKSSFEKQSKLFRYLFDLDIELKINRRFGE